MPLMMVGFILAALVQSPGIDLFHTRHFKLSKQEQHRWKEPCFVNHASMHNTRALELAHLNRM